MYGSFSSLSGWFFNILMSLRVWSGKQKPYYVFSNNGLLLIRGAYNTTIGKAMGTDIREAARGQRSSALDPRSQLERLSGYKTQNLRGFLKSLWLPLGLMGVKGGGEGICKLSHQLNLPCLISKLPEYKDLLFSFLFQPSSVSFISKLKPATMSPEGDFCDTVLRLQWEW